MVAMCKSCPLPWKIAFMEAEHQISKVTSCHCPTYHFARGKKVCVHILKHMLCRESFAETQHHQPLVRRIGQLGEMTITNN